jgi:hypothetical protein
LILISKFCKIKFIKNLKELSMTTTIKLIPGIAVAALLFSGCANKVHNYSASTENILMLKDLAKSGKRVSLGNFTDSGKEESKMMCRLATPIGTPKGETFATYIKDAFKKELLLSGLYDKNSKTKISANLNDIYGSTVLGNAYWSFDITLKSTNGKKMNVKSRYDYESSYFASSACSEMQRSFPLAVQKLIKDIISNPEFKELVK